MSAHGSLSPRQPADREISAIVTAVLLLLPLTFSKFTLDVFRLPKAELIWLAGASILLLIGSRALARRRLELPRGAPFLAATALALVLLTVTPFSLHPLASMIGGRKIFLGLITYLSVFALFIGGCLAGAERLRTAAKPVTIAASITAVFAIAQRLGLAYPIDFVAEFGRGVGGTVGNPDYLGAYIAMALPLTLGWLLSERSLWLRAAAAAALALMVPALVYAGSAAAYLAAAAAGGLFIAHYARSLWRRPAGALAALLLLVVATTAVFGGRTLGSQREQLADRRLAWMAAAAVMSQHPLAGSGLDTLGYTIPAAQSEPTNRVDSYGIFADAHNVLLTLGASAGVPAMLAFAVFCGTVLAAARTVIARANEADKPPLIGVAGALIAYLVATQFNPDSPTSMAYFWLLGGLVTGATYGTRPVEANRRWSIGLLAVTAVWMLALSLLATRLFLAESYLKAAKWQPTVTQALPYFARAERSWPYYDYYPLERFTSLIQAAERDPSYEPATLDAARRAVAANPFESDGQAALGYAYQLLGKRDGDRRMVARSRTAFERSLAINPRNLKAIYGLAETHQLLGDKKAARAALRRFLNLSAEDDPRRDELEALIR